MSDITELNAALPIKVVGSELSGAETNPVNATSGGGLHTNLRDALGNELKGQQLGKNSIPTIPAQEASFVACAESVQIGSGKSMISLFNGVGSGVIVKIKRIFLVNVQVAVVTGVIAEFQIRRVSGHTLGTAISPSEYDTADILNALVTAKTGATVSGEATKNLRRILWSTDEWGTGTSDVESSDHTYQSLTPLYIHQDGSKPITLHPGEGLHVKQTISSTIGTFDLVIEFTQEA